MAPLPPDEHQRLELYAALVEAIAATHKPTESDVQRVLRTLHTGNPEFDREMSEYAETLHLMALHKAYFLYDRPLYHDPINLD